MLFLLSWAYALNSEALFSGRISKMNPNAKLIRIRTDFANAKFFGKKDRIEFWNESHPKKKCFGYLEGRANNYLLIGIPSYKRCMREMMFSTGTYLHLYSKDLANNLKIARDLLDVLLKKRLALHSIKTRHQKEVDSYIEKIDATNKRYEILRQKMEIEWKKELAALEEDKTRAFLSLHNAQLKLNELEYKLQQYRIEDQNLKEDRWSLDQTLYYKK